LFLVSVCHLPFAVFRLRATFTALEHFRSSLLLYVPPTNTAVLIMLKYLQKADDLGLKISNSQASCSEDEAGDGGEDDEDDIGSLKDFIADEEELSQMSQLSLTPSPPRKSRKRKLARRRVVDSSSSSDEDDDLKKEERAPTRPTCFKKEGRAPSVTSKSGAASSSCSSSSSSNPYKQIKKNSTEAKTTVTTVAQPVLDKYKEMLFAIHTMHCSKCQRKQVSQIYVRTDNCETFFIIRTVCLGCLRVAFI
jgi:hypothetical protein